jgi:hypothetical protein
MGKTYIREGFTQLNGTTDYLGNTVAQAQLLAFNLFNDLLDAGFEIVESDTANTITTATKRVIFRPTLLIDPLIGNAVDQWRIFFEITGNAQIPNVGGGTPANFTVTDTGLNFAVGSPIQIPDLANVSASIYRYPIVVRNFENYLTNEQRQFAGVTAEYPRISSKTPMAYRLTVVERGFALGVWTQVLTEDFGHMSLMCVQRGVGCNGDMIATGQKPLYMVTNVSPNGVSWQGELAGAKNLWMYSIVKEVDTSTQLPGWRVDNNAPSHNGYAAMSNVISNPNEPTGQVLNYFPTRWLTPVTTDTGEYVLIFPFGLCSNRFAFSDEIDLIAVSKADAYQSGQTVPITVYGENREYTAYNSNNQHRVVEGAGGVRMFILTNGPDFT